MKKHNKEILVLGDRVLVVPDVGEDRTNVGLYLPKWAVEKESVQGGRIVDVGPGIPMSTPSDIEQEPWKENNRQINYLPIQARVGDYVIFLRKGAIEIKIDDETFLVLPQAAILVVMRETGKSLLNKQSGV
jgi:chaperonin GroES